MKTAREHQKSLDWTDCVGLIVGIMLGTGIFAVFPKLAAAHNPSTLMILAAWGAGTLVALCGAFCFAELASRFPENGGEYVFLKEAFGGGRSPGPGTADGGTASPLSFLFAWAQIFVIRPASLVSLSIIFAVNAEILLRDATGSSGETGLVPVMTVSTLVLFTLLALAGIHASKWIQNAFTLIKVASLAALVGFGLYLGQGKAANLAPLLPPEGASLGTTVKGLGMALIPVMWVFGGWNEAPYIAADMRDPSRNIPKALFAGVAGLGLLYVLINFVYVLHLTPEGLASSWTFSSDLMKIWFGPAGEVVMALVLVISTAGAINGLTVTGARMTGAFGEDLGMLSRGEGNRTSYAGPLLLNLAVSLGTAYLVDCAPESIDRLLVFTAGVIWVFFALTAGAVIVLRRRRPEEAIPYRLPLYPFTPLVFIVMCGYMLYGAWEYKPRETIYGIAALAAGVPVYLAGFRAWARLKFRGREAS